MPKVSVIIPSMLGREKMLDRLLATVPGYCEVIIVKDPDLLLAGKRNKGARQAKGEFLLFIDDDNYLRYGSIEKMLECFIPTIGVMGMTACYSDKKMLIADGGSLRSMLTGFTWGRRTNKVIHIENENLYLVSEVANSFMIRKEVFEDSGGFDEENFPIDLDEADLCRRIKKAGYWIAMNPRAVCYHNSQTYSPIPNFRRPMNAYFMGRNRILYQRKHNNALCYLCYLVFFMPVFLGFYTLSLVYKKNPKMISPFLKGVFDGLRGSLENTYQQKS